MTKRPNGLNLKRHKKMNPLDSRDRIHLEWMFENQPELVRQLHQSGKLRQHLDGKMQQALRMTDNLKRKTGMSEDEAFQAAQESILAPADGPAMMDDPAPEPVPWREQEQIYRKLEGQ